MALMQVLERPSPAGRAAPANRAVAVDVGYWQTKAVSAGGGRACFPSATAPAADDPLNGFFGDPAGHRARLRHPDGRIETRLVGEAALRSLAAVTSLSKQKPADMHDLLVVAAAYLCGAGGTGHLPGQTNLAVGLPLAFYRAQRDALAERLGRLQAWVSVDSSEERYLSFGRVLVLPQGAGAVAAYPDLVPDRGLVGVVDVGEYTTDYLLVEVRDGRPQPVLEACGSAEIGVHLVHRALAAEFQSRTGAPLYADMWQEALEARVILYEGTSVDLTAVAERAISDAAQAVAQRVLGAWGHRAGFVRLTLLVGGGAVLFRDHLLRLLPCAQVPPHPVFANVIGFLRTLLDR